MDYSLGDERWSILRTIGRLRTSLFAFVRCCERTTPRECESNNSVSLTREFPRAPLTSCTTKVPRTTYLIEHEETHDGLLNSLKESM